MGQIYIGILNFYDLISSKILRGESVDFDDCLLLVKARGEEIDKDLLIKRYRELAASGMGEARVIGHIESFMYRWRKEVNENGK